MFDTDLNFLFVFAFMYFGLALLLYWSNSRILREGLAAVGQIVEVSASYGRYGTEYDLQVTFLNEFRRQLRATVRMSSLTKPQIGDRVDLLYLPDRPTVAWLKSEAMIRWPIILFTLLGFMTVFVAMSP